MIKVSVIVVTYNQADTIGRTLDSILMQRTSFPFEIVVGEDASTDSTRAICQDYARRYPEVVRLMPAAPNKGLVPNYFDCLEACRGEYIADCAGDDFWSDPLKLQRQSDFLDSHPSVALVHTAWRPLRVGDTEPGSAVVQPLAEVTPGRDMVLRLLRHDKPQPVHLCTAMYRRADGMAEYGPRRELFRAQCAEDITLSCMMLRSRDAGYIPEPTLVYSVGSDNAVSHPASMQRAAAFYRRSLELTYLLADLTDTPRGAIDHSLRPLTDYALSLAIASGSPEAVSAFRATRRRLGLKLSLRSRLKLMLYGLNTLIPARLRLRRR